MPVYGRWILLLFTLRLSRTELAARWCTKIQRIRNKMLLIKEKAQLAYLLVNFFHQLEEFLARIKPARKMKGSVGLFFFIKLT